MPIHSHYLLQLLSTNRPITIVISRSLEKPWNSWPETSGNHCRRGGRMIEGTSYPGIQRIQADLTNPGFPLCWRISIYSVKKSLSMKSACLKSCCNRVTRIPQILLARASKNAYLYPPSTPRSAPQGPITVSILDQ